MSLPQPPRVVIDGPEQPLVLDKLFVQCTQPISVESDQRDKVSKQWFATEPLDVFTIGRIRALQLHTISHDQGNVDAPEREGTTWFEISVQQPSPIIATTWLLCKNPSTRQGCRWLSHVNPSGRETPQSLSGIVFYPLHELWSNLRSGYRIVVTAVARFPNSINAGLSAKLVFWRFQSPAIRLLTSASARFKTPRASLLASGQTLVKQSGSRISRPAAKYFAFAFRVDPDTFRMWHELSRTLVRGATNRPALPTELVLSVLAFADCLVPDSLRVETYYSRDTVTASSPTRRIWLATEPLDAATLSRISGLQLHTVGRDQRWPEAVETDLGPRTWFEISIQRPKQGRSEWAHVHRLPKREEPYGWISHYNGAEQRQSQPLSGQFFGPDHEIWRELHPGDRLAVAICIPQRPWSTTGMSGRLDFWRRFEPSYW